MFDYLTCWNRLCAISHLLVIFLFCILFPPLVGSSFASLYFTIHAMIDILHVMIRCDLLNVNNHDCSDLHVLVVYYTCMHLLLVFLLCKLSMTMIVMHCLISFMHKSDRHHDSLLMHDIHSCNYLPITSIHISRQFFESHSCTLAMKLCFDMKY